MTDIERAEDIRNRVLYRIMEDEVDRERLLHDVGFTMMVEHWVRWFVDLDLSLEELTSSGLVTITRRLDVEPIAQVIDAMMGHYVRARNIDRAARHAYLDPSTLRADMAREEPLPTAEQVYPKLAANAPAPEWGDTTPSEETLEELGLALLGSVELTDEQVGQFREEFLKSQAERGHLTEVLRPSPQVQVGESPEPPGETTVRTALDAYREHNPQYGKGEG